MKIQRSWCRIRVWTDDFFLCSACTDYEHHTADERAQWIIELSPMGVIYWIAQSGCMDRLPMEYVEPSQGTRCRRCDPPIS